MALRKRRSRVGMTLTELVVSSVLIGFSLAAVGELVVLNTYASTKLTNKVDGQIGCGRAIRRICEDVRHARIIGNVHSTVNQNFYPDSSSGSNDPANVAPVNGWPGAPWPQPPYQLGPQTLIVQQSVLFNDPNNAANPINGFPLQIKAGAIAANIPSHPIEYVDTIVYQIVPSTVENQYLLQVARFSGTPEIVGTTLKSPINPPQTVVSGIVGPLDPANPTLGPAIFQYLVGPTDGGVLKTPTGLQALSLSGVSVNMEAQVPSSNQGQNLEITSAHAESFMRSARYLQVTND